MSCTLWGVSLRRSSRGLDRAPRRTRSLVRSTSCWFAVKMSAWWSSSAVAMASNTWFFRLRGQDAQPPRGVLGPSSNVVNVHDAVSSFVMTRKAGRLGEPPYHMSTDVLASRQWILYPPGACCAGVWRLLRSISNVSSRAFTRSSEDCCRGGTKRTMSGNPTNPCDAERPC